MQHPFHRLGINPALVTIALAGCAGTAPQAGAVTPATDAHAAPAVAPVPRHKTYTRADVDFMTGMISHHAQAVLIAGWAPTHDASGSLRTMCERIVVGQQDEIALMRRWLGDRGEALPDPDMASHMMSGMDHGMMMPGMLSPEQLARLGRARGPEFDRLFLTGMIMHHQGAMTMVNQLFGTQEGGQEQTVFRMASDIFADQSTEIARMQKMLAALPPAATSP